MSVTLSTQHSTVPSYAAPIGDHSGRHSRDGGRLAGAPSLGGAALRARVAASTRSAPAQLQRIRFRLRSGKTCL